MALAALCGDDDWGTTWARVVQHRFGGTGELAGHAVGNLLIAGLWDHLGDGDPVAALDWVAQLLRVTGRVLPMAAVPLDIVASVDGIDPAAPHAISSIRGQAAVAVTPGRVRSISLVPRTRRPCRTRSRRCSTRTGWCSARGRGLPPCCLTCWYRRWLGRWK